VAILCEGEIGSARAGGGNLYTDLGGGYRPPHTPWSGLGQAQFAVFFRFLIFFPFSFLFCFLFSFSFLLSVQI
jgi:hypothetical protein